jgi:hypothetical protein
MPCSEAKLEANRKNAMLSTGPRTQSGKDVSRLNSLTHGLCAKAILPEDPEAILTRSGHIFSALRPQNEFQCWLVDHAAVCTLRIDRCERIERRVRDKICLRAEVTWDEDRKLDVEKLAAMLEKRPSEVVSTLRRTPHGCDWLITRWALLADAADKNDNKKWTEEQTALAFDLLATPTLFRLGYQPGVVVDSEGNIIVATEQPVVLARRMVDELKERREEVRCLDNVDRSLTETDHDFDTDPEIRRVRRYESALHTKLRWAVNLIKEDPAKRPYDAALRYRWENRVVTVTKTPEEIAIEKHVPASIHPPFDLTEEEAPPLGQMADIPAIMKSRKARRAAKSESTRAAKRSKAAKLRA